MELLFSINLVSMHHRLCRRYAAHKTVFHFLDRYVHDDSAWRDLVVATRFIMNMIEVCVCEDPKHRGRRFVNDSVKRSLTFKLLGHQLGYPCARNVISTVHGTKNNVRPELPVFKIWK